MRRSRAAFPIALLGAALAIIGILQLIQRKPEERPRHDTAPLVRVTLAAESPYRFIVTANGSVSPRTESELIPQVSGEIVEMSPSLVPGGFFRKGDLLARIDSADYRVEREAARAQVARAQSEFRRAKKERGRQRLLAEGSVASESRIDDAENAYRIAEASLRESEARLERAERDLTRTEIRAPYRGRVRREQVDLGQFVNRGNPIATLYAVDYAEVRLPIPDRELAYLDAAQLEATLGTLSGDEVERTGARVWLSAEFAGASHTWEGRLVRTEAELDPTSRMVHLVARVADPFGLEEVRSAPMVVGLFVDAAIEGQALDAAYLLPRDALRGKDQVYVVDEEDRIRFRNVEILRTERDRIVVTAGLSPGERICTSALDAPIDGMIVRVAGARQKRPAGDLADANAKETGTTGATP